MSINISDSHPFERQHDLSNALVSLRCTPVPHNLSSDPSANNLGVVVRSILNRFGFWWNFALTPSRQSLYPSFFHFIISMPATWYPSLLASYGEELLIILSAVSVSLNRIAFCNWIQCSDVLNFWLFIMVLCGSLTTVIIPHGRLWCRHLFSERLGRQLCLVVACLDLPWCSLFHW